MAKTKGKRVSAADRRCEILRLVEQQGRVSVEEVSLRFHVSSVTARADLDALSAGGALFRYHGGGAKPSQVDGGAHLHMGHGLQQADRTRMAKAAVDLILPWETVILCGGETCVEMASHLVRTPKQGIAAITYSLDVANMLAGARNISLVLLGGFMRPNSKALVGPHAEEMMLSLHADHCFLSAAKLDAEVGLTTLDIMEAQLNRSMIESAARVTVLADGGQFGQRSLAFISDLKRVQRVITNQSAPFSEIEKLRQKGVEVILV